MGVFDAQLAECREHRLEGQGILTKTGLQISLLTGYRVLRISRAEQTLAPNLGESFAVKKGNNLHFTYVLVLTNSAPRHL